MSRVARTWQTALAALGVVLFAVGLGTVATTTAAWTDPAVVTLQASTGQWETAAAGPVSPGRTDTVLSNLVWESMTNNPIQVCFTVQVSSTSATPVPWAVNVDLAQAPFHGATGGFSLQGNDGWRAQLTYGSPGPGLLQITPSANGEWTTVDSDTSRAIKLCHYGLPNPPDTPSAYSVVVTDGTPAGGTWGQGRACRIVTVSGNGSSEFYVGWRATVDMSGAIATAGGRRWQNNEWTDSVVIGAFDSENRVTISSLAPTSVKGTDTFVYQACVQS